MSKKLFLQDQRVLWRLIICRASESVWAKLGGWALERAAASLTRLRAERGEVGGTMEFFHQAASVAYWMKFLVNHFHKEPILCAHLNSKVLKME